MKVLVVFGTRPEAIKMAPVVEALRKTSSRIETFVCVTGQHREMLRQVLDLFGIEPDFDLALMNPNQTLSELTSNLFSALDDVMRRIKPDWVLAQGDTTTAMVAALEAYYHKARFGHVEAGLRTGDLFSPWPEEGNRKIADAIAGRLWAPTERAKSALLDEGVPQGHIAVTGNTVIDALHQIVRRPYDSKTGPLAPYKDLPKIVLVTAHRRESFGGPLEQICDALRCLAEDHGPRDVHFVYPVHLNPNVREPVQRILKGLDNLHLVEPLAYLDMVQLMKRSLLILTDSGGIQEEAPALGIPVLVMRDKTERPEGIEAGVCRLVGTNKRGIVDAAARLLNDEGERLKMTRCENPYGDGKASQRIVADIVASRPHDRPPGH